MKAYASISGNGKRKLFLQDGCLLFHGEDVIESAVKADFSHLQVSSGVQKVEKLLLSFMGPQLRQKTCTRKQGRTLCGLRGIGIADYGV